MASTNIAPSTLPNCVVPRSRKHVASLMEPTMHTFGYLFEVMSTDPKTFENELLRLRTQYRKRLYLARLSGMPEGWRFKHKLDTGGEHTVPLLSPPELVAERRANGIWYRRVRHAFDGPQPYSNGFYKEYLCHYDLPLWFLCPGHLGMLYDTAEARLLGITVPDPLPDAQPDYIEEQYSLRVVQPPMLPHRPNGYLLCGLSHADTLFLARRFPATTVEFKFMLYITESGHIMLRSVKNRVDEGICLAHLDTYVKSDDLPAWHFEDPDNIKASYRLEVHDKNVRPSSEALTRARQSLAVAHAADGNLVNPEVVPVGFGRWAWFDDTVDQHTAISQGYGPDFVGITEARGSGSIPSEPDSTNFPAVVWIPDKDFHNLDAQPPGAGSWEFMTSGGDNTDDVRTAEHFGGRHQLPDQPNARQIFRLRRKFVNNKNARRPEALDNINIVWITSNPDPSPDTEAEPDIDTEPETEGDEAAVDVDFDDDVSESDFDATNGEPDTDHDQTCTDADQARYYTSRIGGKIITLDRSRIVLGEKQIWKTWAYTNKGWLQYPRFNEVDWDSQKSLDMVAKWRDQANRRAGWPLLRNERPVYSVEERQFVRARVQQAVDAGAAPNNVELYREFKKAFMNDRTEQAIAALGLRLRREIKGEIAMGEGDDGVEGEEETEQKSGEDIEEDDDARDDAIMDEQQSEEYGRQQRSDDGYQVAQLDFGNEEVPLLEDVPMEEDEEEDSLFIT